MSCVFLVISASLDTLGHLELSRRGKSVTDLCPLSLPCIGLPWFGFANKLNWNHLGCVVVFFVDSVTHVFFDLV